MRKVKLLAAMLAVLMLFSACGNSKTEKKGSADKKAEQGQYITWEPVYNDHQCGLQANRTEVAGLRHEPMSEEDVQSVMPADLLSSFKTTGTAAFKEGNTVYNVLLQMRLQEGTATILLGNDVNGGACCLSIGFGGTETKSKCGELEYSIFRQITKDGMILEAFSKINGIPFLLRIDTKNAQNNKIVFERILEAFARTKADTLTLSGIKPN